MTNTDQHPNLTTKPTGAKGEIHAHPHNKAELPKRIGEYLVSRKIVSRDIVEVALIEQKESHQASSEPARAMRLPLGEIISRLSPGNSEGLLEALAAHIDVALAQLSTLKSPAAEFDPSDPLACALDLARTHNISIEWMRQAQFLPISLHDKALTLAMSQPQDITLIDSLASHLPPDIHIVPQLALSKDINHTINRLELQKQDPHHQVGQLGQQLEQASESSERHRILVAMIDKLFEAALFEHASDIHFAPGESTLRVLFRIDGVLQTRYRIHPRFAPAVSVRIKVLANLDISETRLPQDGSLKSSINGMDCDLRVSTLPTQYGESLVIRLHGRDLWRCDIDKSGLPPVTVSRIQRLLRKPHGLVLIAGPTGSGKSTTLYAMIKSLRVEEKSVVTLEDPIEYSLGETIRQTGINESIGLSFGAALRSVLRQDPDVIMVGEIRDREVAEMSLWMSMTGHLVLATIHCDSALSVHQRLRLLGLDPEIFADQLIACLSQRLARVACPHCSYLRPPCPADGLDQDTFGSIDKLLDVRGCQRCGNTGYQGRRPILEMLAVNADVADLIAKRGSRAEMRALAEQEGFVSLQEQVSRAVINKSLTPQEAQRIAG